MKIFLAVLLGLFLFSASAWADSSPHRVLVWYSGPQAEKYLRSLEAVLTGEKLGLWVLSSQLPSDAPEADLVKEARRFACDLILTVDISVSDKDQVSWSLLSPEELRPRASGTVVKAKPDWSAAADLYWLFLIKPLSLQLGPGALAWPKPLVAEKVSLTIEALPGTLVNGLPSGPVVLGPSGAVQVWLEIPVSVPLEGHLVGWRTKAARVFVDKSGQKVTLEQKKLPSWALTASLNNFAFPSFGAEWMPAGNWVVRVQIDQFLGGLYFADQANATENSWPVQSLPLTTLQLGGAYYWSWPEDRLRFYTSLDLGIRWMFPQFKIFTVDPVVPLTIEPLAGWDYRWAEGQSVFFELGPTIEWAPNTANFLASERPNSSSLELQLPGPFFLELPLKAKAGYRWSF
jgi:hypothetical protein